MTTASGADGVVRFPEQVDDLLERDLTWRKFDLNGFGMIPEASIRRRILVTSGVANSCFVNACNGPKLGLGSPESAQCKCCGLQIGRDVLINYGGQYFLVGLHKEILCVQSRGQTGQSAGQTVGGICSSIR